MRRIVLLWLVLTPIWIGFSFYASASKIALVPPALVVIVLVLYWLHKQLVVALAGEPEPRPSAQPRPRPSRQPSRSSYVRPLAASLRGLVRPIFIAVGVGACIGAAAAPFFQLDRRVSDDSTAAHAVQPNGAISVRTEAIKSQSFAAEPSAVPTMEAKPQMFAAAPKIQDNSTVTSAHNAAVGRAEAQISTDGQISSNQSRCNVSLCESYYQSFRASDCSYQPYSGPRQYCTR